MTDYSKLTKDELGKKLDDAMKEIQDLKVEKIKTSSDRIKAEKKKDEAGELNLAQKLAKAMGDMGALAKDGTNQSQRWTFISEAAIKAAIRRVASKYGFVIIPTKIIKTEKYERKTSRGGMLYFYDVIQEFTITDGKDSVTAQMIGTGSDAGDKAVNKAVTVAFKNLEKQLFNVSDQNDPDPDSETNEATVANDDVKQVAKVIDWSQPSKININDLRNHVVKYPNGMAVTIETVLKHVRKGNTNAKKFADSLKGNDKIAYIELDKRTLQEAMDKISDQQK